MGRPKPFTTVPCPTCGAPTGQTCRTTNHQHGTPRKAHAARRRAVAAFEEINIQKLTPASRDELEVGEVVRFHPIIGLNHDGRRYTVRATGRSGSGEAVVWLHGKSGFVALAAVSRVADEELANE